MALIEHETEETLSREDAAERLRALADELARQNSLTFQREGKRYTIEVPDQVRFTLEIEAGGDESEIEVELKWKAGG